LSQDSKDQVWIIVDFEWNQAIPWLRASVSPKELPGEIIDFGAVKLRQREGDIFIEGIFSRQIRPVVYTVMHKQVSQIIHKETADLGEGSDFPTVYRDFQEWCGENWRLCGWSLSDIGILKSNLSYHKMDAALKTDFLDVQFLFSLLTGDIGTQKSVKFAVEYFEIEQSEDFHSAVSDAEYTAKILLHLLRLSEKRPEISIETYLMNPDLKKETIENSESFSSWDMCFSVVKEKPLYCPACGALLKKRKDWFRLGKTGFSLWFCEEHHIIYGRMKMKKTMAQKTYASIRLRLDGVIGERIVAEKKALYDIYGPKGPPRKTTPPAELVEEKKP